jgi:Ca2+-binding RTX toxin-like protein
MSKFYKNARKWTGLERLESRITPDIQFGFEILDPGDGVDRLFFTIEGDAGNNVVTLDTQNNGNVLWSATFEEGGGQVTAFGIITAGDFANAVEGLVTIGGFHVVGGAGHDTINASEFEDPVGDVHDEDVEPEGGLTNYRLWAEGGTGNDVIAGGFRSDWLEGQDNNDTLVVAMGVNDLTSGGDKGESGGSNGRWMTRGGDQLLIGTGEAITEGGRTVINTDIETITGGDEGERIDNSGFADDFGSTKIGVVVNAGGGNDTVVSSSRNDRLRGGDQDKEGGDTLSYEGSKSGVQVNLANTNQAIGGGNAEGDDAAQFENATGSDHDDSLIGSSGANVLTGGDGDDELSGASGNDTLFGNEGEDEMEGGLGADVLDGGDDNDTMEGGIGNDTMTGGDGDDTIDAGAGDDTIVLNYQELDEDDDNATHGGLNDADAFFGGPTDDLFLFINMPEDDGDVDDDAINETVQYLDDQLDDGMNDWDETRDDVDWVPED